MGFKVIYEPTAELLTLDEVRLHLRLDAYDSPAAHPDDPIVTALIAAAREFAENYTGRSLALRTVELTLDAFPACRNIPLTMPPLFAVEFVRYIDSDEVEQTFTGWTLNDYVTPARIELDPGIEWPATFTQVNAVRVRLQTGYMAADESPSGTALPKSVRQAMLLVIGHMYENREASSVVSLNELPLSVTALLQPYRLYTAHGQ